MARDVTPRGESALAADVAEEGEVWLLPGRDPQRPRGGPEPSLLQEFFAGPGPASGGSEESLDRAVLPFLAAAGLLHFGLAPAQVLLGVHGASCGGAAPSLAYGLAALVVAIVAAGELQLLRHRRSGGYYLERSYGRMVRLQPSPSAAALDVWPVLWLLGKAELLGWQAGAMQPGLVASCWSTGGSLLAAWLCLLSLSILVQVPRFAYCLRQAHRLHAVERRWRKNTLPTEELVPVYEFAAEASELVGASLLGKFYGEAAAEARFDAHGWDARGLMAMQDLRYKLLYAGVATRVLLESAPALWLSVAFFGLSWTRAGVVTKLVTGLCIVLSAVACLRRAAKCLEADKSHSCLVGFSIVAWVLVMAAKFVGGFFCDSHLYSAFPPQCV